MDSSRHDWCTLIDSFLAGTLDPSELASVAAVLKQSEAARRYYLECMDVNASLLWALHLSGDQAPDDKGAGDRGTPSIPYLSSAGFGALNPPESTPSPANVPPLAASRTWIPSTVLGLFSVNPWVAATAGVLLLFVGLLAGRVAMRSGDVAEQAAVSRTMQRDTSDPLPGETFVARITRISDDLRWADGSGNVDFLLRLRANQAVEIVSGLLQVEFSDGAMVIVHGPAHFTPTGPAASRLDTGRITANASSGNFTLCTAAADVVDLGTCFGVSVDADAGTDVVVFEGEARVTSHSQGDEPSEVLNLVEGNSARVRNDGTTDYEYKPDDTCYTRAIVSGDKDDNESADTLSLVDIVSGGNGTDHRLSGAIDSLNGANDTRLAQGSTREQSRLRSCGFQPVAWHPLIDGVFVPAETGSATQVDTSGHTVDLPKNSGMAWGAIWARRWDDNVQLATTVPDFWPKRDIVDELWRLQESRVGMTGLHANAGITFDLRAIHLQRHRPVLSFHGKVLNLDSTHLQSEDAIEKDPRADFRIYVDGVLKYSRIGFGHNDGDEEFAVSLEAADSRLTLISTDYDQSYNYDHVALIDPILVLEPLSLADEDR